MVVAKSLDADRVRSVRPVVSVTLTCSAPGTEPAARRLDHGVERLGEVVAVP